MTSNVSVNIISALMAFVILSVSSLAFAQSLPGTTALEPDATQQATKLPEKLTSAIIREIVSNMDDASVRRLLLERLDAVAQRQVAESGTTISIFVQIET